MMNQEEQNDSNYSASPQNRGSKRQKHESGVFTTTLVKKNKVAQNDFPDDEFIERVDLTLAGLRTYPANKQDKDLGLEGNKKRAADNLTWPEFAAQVISWLKYLLQELRKPYNARLGNTRRMAYSLATRAEFFACNEHILT